mmetsp:Transcript_31619/g.71119  ORF Transcript_31619/g.71119 Transcript_31619/m.71119 type:complete len:204 (+) Transcript_31619:270-881(+)
MSTVVDRNELGTCLFVRARVAGLKEKLQLPESLVLMLDHGSKFCHLFIHGVAGCLNLFQFDMKSVVQLLPALFEVASQSQGGAVEYVCLCFDPALFGYELVAFGLSVLSQSLHHTGMALLLVFLWLRHGTVTCSFLLRSDADDCWHVHDLVQDRLGGKVSHLTIIRGYDNKLGCLARSFRTQLDSSKPHGNLRSAQSILRLLS